MGYQNQKYFINPRGEMLLLSVYYKFLSAAICNLTNGAFNLIIHNQHLEEEHFMPGLPNMWKQGGCPDLISKNRNPPNLKQTA